MEVSVRLKEIASMVTPGSIVADVGTDHGYLAIYLIHNKIANKVIAMDVAKGPLSTAVGNVNKAGLSDCIETRLSDGVESLREGEADTVVMAGMGGNLIIRLLTNGADKLFRVNELILSPQSELEQVRNFLLSHSYIIMEERMLTEDGKNYVIIRVIHDDGQQELKQKVINQHADDVEGDVPNNLIIKNIPYKKRCDLKYGRLLLESKNPVLYTALLKEKEQLSTIKEQLQSRESVSVNQRLQEIEADLECIAEGLKYYEM